MKNMCKNNRIQFFQSIKKKLSNHSDLDIRNSVVVYLVKKSNATSRVNPSSLVAKCILSSKKEIIDVLIQMNFPLEIDFFIDFLEFLVGKNDKLEKGIIFTPKYIADFIIKDSLSEIRTWNESFKIIDPSCGCGIFLISAIEFIHTKFNVGITSIINNNIYGIDILEENAYWCKVILELFCILNGVENAGLKLNIKSKNSLAHSWKVIFGTTDFNFIIGNPPYVNPHAMNEETTTFLKQNFKTTHSGVFNIFYAFVEHALAQLAQDGYIEFIIPNNFLTIKSAKNLRALLEQGKHVHKIIDFSENMVFKPTRTYNCILKLSSANKNSLPDYIVLEKTNNIEKRLENIIYKKMDSNSFSANGWRLRDRDVNENIRKIEIFSIKLKPLIKTGIATLHDSTYMVHRNNNGYYAITQDKCYPIEADIIKPIYKIPELKNFQDIEEAQRFIIFPYENKRHGHEIIPEDIFLKRYPLAYEYLLSRKDILAQRDKGKLNKAAWYAYGRTQSLNNYGKKLIFPTFSDKPNFTYINDKNTLFCNGYAIFESGDLPLDIVGKIVNSIVMDYYIRNTSYAIEGGYYCYQKKYLEGFSFPDFNSKELELLRYADRNTIDAMLSAKYQIKI